MLLHEWTTLAASTGQLSLGVLTALRGGRSPLVYPLALLCFCLFGWNIADLAYTISADPAWKLFDHALSPFTSPLVLHFVLAFTGMRRRFHIVLVAAYALLGALSLSALLGFVWAPTRDFQVSDAWSVVHVLLAVPTMLFAVVCLALHRRDADRPGWQRARLILVGLSIAMPLGMTDLLEGVLPVELPPLANVGTLLGVVFLTVVTLRLRVFGTDLSTSAVTLAAGLSLIVVFAYAGLSSLFLDSPQILVLVTATAALMVGLLLRVGAAASAERHAREAQLVTLGRFAAQMGHDLKNPLAAMKGAVQFLLEERRRGASLDASAAFLDLLLAQVERMERSLDDYQRLSRVEPAPTRLDLNDMVREVMGLAAFADTKSRVELALEPELPALEADRDLLARALENLVRNALESMPDGGTVTVTTARVAGGVVLAVRDTGEGMDAVTRERAFDDFFTTKAQGSGMGLPFARRVALAHGGDLVLSSRPGRGTAVEMRLARGSKT